MDASASLYPERPGMPDCIYYLRTGGCGFGVDCRFNHPPDKKAAVAPASIKDELPVRVGRPECRNYLTTGTCRFGSLCKFHHPCEKATFVDEEVECNVVGLPMRLSPINPSSSLEGWQPESINNENVQRQIEPAPAASGISSLQGDEESEFPERPGKQDCQFYMKTGSCKFGGSCKFHHAKERKAQAALCMLNVVGLPLRMGQPHCAFYMRYGICKFGSTCKYDHPVIYSSPTPSHYDMAVNSRPRITSPISILASKSSSEASQEVSKLQDVAVEANTQVIQESEEVNSQ